MTTGQVKHFMQFTYLFFDRFAIYKTCMHLISQQRISFNLFLLKLDEDCSGRSDTEYCNGPLDSSSNYYIALRAYSEGNVFQDGPFSEAVSTS